MAIRSTDAPQRYTYRFDAALGGQLRESTAPGGGFEFVRGGRAVAHASAPVAWDADGQPVKLTTTISGEELNIDVDLADQDVKLPVLLDPIFSASEQFETWFEGNTDRFDGWTPWKSHDAFAFSTAPTDVNWGRGLYTFARDWNYYNGEVGEWSIDAEGVRGSV